MKQQEQDNHLQAVTRRGGRKLQRAFRLRRNLGSFYLSDSSDQYWSVHIRVSKRKGRYLKLERQGAAGHLDATSIRATADHFVPPRSGRIYQSISPGEWARFAELANRLKGKAADEKDTQVLQARATLDRLAEDLRRPLV